MQSSLRCAYLQSFSQDTNELIGWRWSADNDRQCQSPRVALLERRKDDAAIDGVRRSHGNIRRHTHYPPSWR
jgi:hypothetical protein